MQQIDATQEALLNEKCFLVDEQDRVIGEATKRECHTVGVDGNIKLHRAFSVILFTNDGKLVLQRRASTKVTYPNVISNTCCSHPLVENSDEADPFQAVGVKRAAQRRLNYELGLNDIQIHEIHYVGRIHYKDPGNGQFGEHEIDYILIVQKDVQFNVNPNEVSEIIQLKIDELDEFTRKNKQSISPWFRMLVESGMLEKWWRNLNDLNRIKNLDVIVRF